MQYKPGMVPLVACLLLANPAFANGFGEQQGFQFRTPSERQVLTIQEQTRLQFIRNNSGSVGAPGIGQTGNQISITITGSGDNTVDLAQDNAGDQSIQDVAGDVVDSALQALLATP